MDDIPFGSLVELLVNGFQLILGFICFLVFDRNEKTLDSFPEVCFDIKIMQTSFAGFP